MGKFNLAQSNIFDGFVAEMRAKKMSCQPEQFELVSKGIFHGIAKYLSDAKNPKNPIGFTVTDLKGEILMIAYVQYVEPEGNGETPGSWLIGFSFNENDMPENAVVTDIKDISKIFTTFDGEARNLGYYYFASSDIIIIATSLIRSILDWLDANISESEEAEVSQEGVFDIIGTFENGEKINGITIAEEIKNIIKGTGDDILVNANR